MNGQLESGPSDGAGQVSGSPWHMRTLQLDGAGNKNQDRSIQPSAIVGELPPFALAPPTPAPRPTPIVSGPRPSSPATGVVFVIFSIAVAAAEAAVGLALVIAIYRHQKNIRLQEAVRLKG